VHRWLALALVAGCQGELATVPCASLAAEPWPEADRLFLDEHWQGGASAYSVDLGGGRVLWLFGDSRVDGARISNTIAIQTGLDPTSATMSFFPGQLVPDQGTRKLRPRGGARLGSGVILWFAAGDDGWTGFWVPNPDEDPSLWRREETFLPATRFPVTLGTAVVVDGSFVYAYGHGDDRVYLARFDYGDAQGVDLSRPQWWSGEWVSHTAFAPDGPSLFPGEAREQPAELSVSASPEGFLAVHALGASIGARTAPALTGPWSPPCSALEIGDLGGATGHPELTGADLVITAIVDGRPRFYKLHRL